MKKNGKFPSLADFEVDVVSETAGEWFPIEVKDKEGTVRRIEVKLRSPFCEDFQRIRGKLQQQRKVFNLEGNADVVGVQRCHREAIGACLLIDWRGLPEPFTRELAEAVMTEHRYRKLCAGIEALVQRLSNDEEVARAAEGKDSEPLSATASSSPS